MGFYINDQLPSQTIKPEIPSEIDILTIQITLLKAVIKS